MKPFRNFLPPLAASLALHLMLVAALVAVWLASAPEIDEPAVLFFFNVEPSLAEQVDEKVDRAPQKSEAPPPAKSSPEPQTKPPPEPPPAPPPAEVPRPEPVVVPAEPVTSRPEPVVARPEPVAPRSEPTVAQPSTPQDVFHSELDDPYSVAEMHRPLEPDFNPIQAAPEQSRIDAPPCPERTIRPVYPRGARRRGEQGSVLLEIRVNEDGTVDAVKVVEGSGHSELDEAALQAVRKAKFVPAKSGSRCVPSITRLKLVFKLKSPARF